MVDQGDSSEDAWDDGNDDDYEELDDSSDDEAMVLPGRWGEPHLC